jgi:membrane protein implicated in regulation of membrane protease activity
MKHETKMLLVISLSVLVTMLLIGAITFFPGLFYGYAPPTVIYALAPLVVVAASAFVKFLDKRHYKQKDKVVVKK